MNLNSVDPQVKQHPGGLLRKFLIDYCRKTTPSEAEKKYYKVGWFEGNNYFGFQIDSIRILAASELEAILIFKDYQNDVIFKDRLRDAYDDYDDDCFWDRVNERSGRIYEANWKNYKTVEFLTRFFQSERIDKLIEDYVGECFDNDTLWFDIAVEPKALTANFD